MRKIPFPQANSLERIYSIFMSIDNSGISKFDVLREQGLAEREGAYYLDALYFLGLVEKHNTKYFLSQSGNDLQLICRESGKKSFAKMILQHKFFEDVYKKRESFGEKKMFREFLILKISVEYQLGLNTAKRRASSVVAWLQWIDESLNDE